MSSITPMRIRVLAEPQSGVPQVKSWFNVEQESTVGALKLSLCASISALREARVKAVELVLLLDDFELLDNTAVHVLRDGDLVCLRRRTHPTKRKAEVAKDAPRKRHKRYETSDSSCSTSCSSTTSDDSSSDSGSTSTSDSDSSSASSASNDEPPPASKPLKKFQRPTPAPVPPGFGKPETRARNERRRQKRVHERAAKIAPPPVPGDSANATPLGVTKLSTEPMLMLSLKNKNKRRGFKNTTSGAPAHITFQDGGHDVVAPSQPPQRLIPPSERDELPPRLFVTSVDVEAGMWPRDDEQKWDRKKKKVQRDAYGYAAEEQADVKLDYGEEDITTASDLDYAALEKAWATAPALEYRTALPVGSVVGWQELGINPATLTPETLLFLSRVVSSEEDGPVVVRLRRPGLGVASFAGGDVDTEDEEEKFPWGNIVSMQWRLVRASK